MSNHDSTANNQPRSRPEGNRCMVPLEVVAIQNGNEQAVTTPSPLDQACEYARRSKAANTIRGYRSDWRDFTVWCEGHGVCALPASPETVAAYLAESASRLKVGS